jgi:hypothetical protein
MFFDSCPLPSHLCLLPGPEILDRLFLICASLYGAVLHESCRNSVRARGSKIAQPLMRQGIRIFSRARCFTFSTVAQTLSFDPRPRTDNGRPEAAGYRPEDRPGTSIWVPTHTSAFGSPIPMRARESGRKGRGRRRSTVARERGRSPKGQREEAVQGRRPYARPRRRSSIPITSRPLREVPRRRVMGRTTFEDGPSADSCGKSQFRASLFGFRLPPLVPGRF